MELPRPSGAHQWSICSGSLIMQDAYPEDEESLAAREGTACHWLAEQLVTCHKNNNRPPPTKDEMVGQLTPTNVVIDEEMWQGASDYVENILTTLGDDIGSLRIEETVLLDNIYKGMSGTPDAWYFDPIKKVLWVWDLKYGYGIVEPFENPQLIIYVSGILAILKLQGVPDTQIKVVMKIVQPRAYHHEGTIREWYMEASALRPYFNKLHHASHEAMGKNTRCITGNHCRYCTATHSCKALQYTIYNTIDVLTMSVPSELDGDNLGFELSLLKRASKLIDYRLAGIESQVVAELSKGVRVPGWGVQPKLGRKRWKADIPQSEVIMMGDLMGVDLRKPVTLDTPTQAIAKLKKEKVNIDVIKEYSEIPRNGFKLEIDDGTKARKAFFK